MSDALSNREIEDVLISIRRLVAQEGGRQNETTRLVLTEAQRVLDQVVESTASQPDVMAAGQDDTPETAPQETSGKRSAAMPNPDFSQLEATIAELEAAVSAGDTAWEPEGETSTPAASNVTELYGRLSFNRRPAEPAPEAQEPAADASHPEVADAEPTDAPDVVAAQEADAAAPETQALPESSFSDLAEAAEDAEDAGFAEADHGVDADDAFLDEEMLRALIAQMVRDELHGQLGERITQQVRKLVRAEIAKALADRTVF